MPVRQLNRQQTWLLPPTLNELIPDDHPARFVAMIVDSLDAATWQKLSIELEGDPLGAPAYHPRAMLGVWLYGFMTNTRSSRKLEAACRDQIPYLWLTGWQHPDHNSLWRFYKAHRKEMRHLFKLTVKTAVKMNLIDLAVQAVDGTKIAANAAKERTYDQKGLQKLLERVEKVIQELEKENQSGNDPAPVHLPEKLRKAEQLRVEVKAAMEQLAAEGQKNINLTDDEANLMKGRQGFIAGYNLEAVVSPLKVSETGKTGLFMTAEEVVPDPADTKQLIPMLEQAEEDTGQKAAISLGDAGFHSGANLAACEQREQVIVMPEVQERALRQPYHKDRFIYDVNTDRYQCPCGQTLKFVKQQLVRRTTMRIYRGSGAICRKCHAFGTCTKDKHHGRVLQIGEYEAEIRRHREWMTSEEAKVAYKQRKELIEPCFGIVKEVMGIRRFLLRGLDNVRAEANVLATAFNLRTLYGVWKAWTSDKRSELFTTIQKIGDYILDYSTILTLFKEKRPLASKKDT
jgi:transposase